MQVYYYQTETTRRTVPIYAANDAQVMRALEHKLDVIAVIYTQEDDGYGILSRIVWEAN